MSSNTLLLLVHETLPAVPLLIRIHEVPAQNTAPQERRCLHSKRGPRRQQRFDTLFHPKLEITVDAVTMIENA